MYVFMVEIMGLLRTLSQFSAPPVGSVDEDSPAGTTKMRRNLKKVGKSARLCRD